MNTTDPRPTEDEISSTASEADTPDPRGPVPAVRSLAKNQDREQLSLVVSVSRVTGCSSPPPRARSDENLDQ